MTRLAHDWFPRALPPNLALAESSWLYSSYAFLHCHSTRPVAVSIGRSSGMYAGFFDLGPDGQVEIGDFTTLVHVDIASNGLVRIGSYCFLAHRVVLAEHAFATPVMGAAEKSGDLRRTDIVLEDDVWVGMGAVLLGGAHIGAGSIVGAGAVVDFAVPPEVVVAGNPARIVRSLARS
jgi:acetyltransferase-like isoleucine patch superfamily enzyme